MRTFYFSFVMFLFILTGCGKSGSGTESVSESPSSEGGSENSSVASVPAGDRQSDTYIISRVQAIYDDVLAEYNKADEEETVPPNSPDEKYCSKEWNEWLVKVQEYDQANNPDDIGFFDADYWVMGQDFSDLSVSDIQVMKHDGDKAVVELKLHNSGNTTQVSLDLSFERGDWFIDNFKDLSYDLDWKDSMKDYLKQ